MHDGTEAIFLAEFDAFYQTIKDLVPPEERICDDIFDSTFAIARSGGRNRANILARLKISRKKGIRTSTKLPC
jgi:hypothetical protein